MSTVYENEATVDKIFTHPYTDPILEENLLTIAGLAYIIKK